MSAPRKHPAPIILARTTSWTLERIQALSTPELRSLHANAERLQEPEVAALCVQTLSQRPRGLPPARPAVKRKPRVRVEEE
jgi:hypothetical protein